MRQNQIPKGMSFVTWQDNGARQFQDLVFNELIDNFDSAVYNAGGMVTKIIRGDD